MQWDHYLGKWTKTMLVAPPPFSFFISSKHFLTRSLSLLSAILPAIADPAKQIPATMMEIRAAVFMCSSAVSGKNRVQATRLSTKMLPVNREKRVTPVLAMVEKILSATLATCSAVDGASRTAMVELLTRGIGLGLEHSVGDESKEDSEGTSWII